MWQCSISVQQGHLNKLKLDSVKKRNLKFNPDKEKKFIYQKKKKDHYHIWQKIWILKRMSVSFIKIYKIQILDLQNTNFRWLNLATVLHKTDTFYSHHFSCTITHRELVTRT